MEKRREEIHAEELEQLEEEATAQVGVDLTLKVDSSKTLTSKTFKVDSGKTFKSKTFTLHCK